MSIRSLPVLLLAGCAASGGTQVEQAASARTSSTAWIPSDAAAGLVDPEVSALFVRHWAWTLERSPEWATELGVHRFDDRVRDNSKEGLDKESAERKALLEAARSLAARSGLGPADQAAVEMLRDSIAADVASEVCAFHEWSISAQGNPVTHWNYLPQLHPIRSLEDAANLIARYKQIPRHIDLDIENLRRGLSRGLVASAETVRRVIAMVEKQLAQPLEQWPLLDPMDAPEAGKLPIERAAFRSNLESIVRLEVKPALERYLALLQSEILPNARPETKSGLKGLPLGAACYAARIHTFTTLELTPEELHETGLKEIARINSEMESLGQKLFGTPKLAEILKKMRDDPRLYFQREEEIEAKAKATLDLARSKLDAWFGVLPKASCVVSRIPDYEAPYTTIAYYRAPVPDGSRPGQYFVNVFAPQTRPRFEAAVLAVHESIPGHHLQIAIAQELKETPAFFKHSGPDAFTEGWALYTERLAEEMGLYESDLDRMGMLSFDAWRASRLVVDTGLHAFGWSRKRAVDFMIEHTALAENNVVNEVDRYIVWPGQALAYKTGQFEIIRLRKDGQARLGDRFDLRQFHDAVLTGGAVSLPALRKQVERYVSRLEKEKRAERD
jgi:uncharacterized protein (DUF885 family)